MVKRYQYLSVGRHFICSRYCAIRNEQLLVVDLFVLDAATEAGQHAERTDTHLGQSGKVGQVQIGVVEVKLEFAQHFIDDFVNALDILLIEGDGPAFYRPLRRLSRKTVFLL